YGFCFKFYKFGYDEFWNTQMVAASKLDLR
ncbi:unnamed protein product, partial [marine sediment metagenome]